MPFDHFSTEQIVPLLISVIFLVASILSFTKNRKLSLSFLFIGSLGIGYFIANLDHFLILWDEQYHALVAKHLAQNPLKPILISDPILGFEYRNWTANNIWLHKQPLFLWQMALSIKLFGTSVLAVRLPSIIMHAIIPLFIYRIGKIGINARTGFYGALLFAVAYFPLELVSGTYTTDHNDVAFLFYVIASFWAWFEYEKSKKRSWLILIGLFSGGAVLVKWLMGLLIFVIWSITKFIVDPENRRKFKSWLPIIYSIIISLITFLPWQIYIILTYPKESSYEYKLNGAHFFHAIEGHAETTWFYFTDGLSKIYGSGFIIPFLLLSGVICLVFNSKNRMTKIAIPTTIAFVYIFYTVAATKMTAFPIIVAPLVYLGLGCLIDRALIFIKKKVKVRYLPEILAICLPLLLAYSALNLSKIENYHTYRKPNDNNNRENEEIEMRFIRSLDAQLHGEPYVIFNASITVNGNIPIMFFTNYDAYNYVPGQSVIAKVKSMGRKVAVVDNGKLPKFILDNPDVKKLKVNMMSPRRPSH